MKTKNLALIAYIIIGIIGFGMINPTTTKQIVGVVIFFLMAQMIEYWKCKYFYKNKIQKP